MAASGSGSANRWSVPTSINDWGGRRLFIASSTECWNGITSSCWECKTRELALVRWARPHFFQAGHSRTKGMSPLCMLIAMAPPREEPTMTSGEDERHSDSAIWIACSNASSGREGLVTWCPFCLRKVGFRPPGILVHPWRKRIFIVVRAGGVFGPNRRVLRYTCDRLAIQLCDCSPRFSFMLGCRPRESPCLSEFFQPKGCAPACVGPSEGGVSGPCGRQGRGEPLGMRF